MLTFLLEATPSLLHVPIGFILPGIVFVIFFLYFRAYFRIAVFVFSIVFSDITSIFFDVEVPIFGLGNISLFKLLVHFNAAIPIVRVMLTGNKKSSDVSFTRLLLKSLLLQLITSVFLTLFFIVLRQFIFTINPEVDMIMQLFPIGVPITASIAVSMILKSDQNLAFLNFILGFFINVVTIPYVIDFVDLPAVSPDVTNKLITVLMGLIFFLSSVLLMTVFLREFILRLTGFSSDIVYSFRKPEGYLVYIEFFNFLAGIIFLGNWPKVFINLFDGIGADTTSKAVNFSFVIVALVLRYVVIPWVCVFIASVFGACRDFSAQIIVNTIRSGGLGLIIARDILSPDVYNFVKHFFVVQQFFEFIWIINSEWVMNTFYPVNPIPQQEEENITEVQKNK